LEGQRLLVKHAAGINAPGASFFFSCNDNKWMVVHIINNLDVELSNNGYNAADAMTRPGTDGKKLY